MQLSILKTALAKPILAAPSRRKRGWRRRIVHGILLGLFLAILGEAGRVLFATNFHSVLPGRAYRSSQLSPARLQAEIEKHGIRTVVNLRGCCDGLDWYSGESQLTHDLNVSLEDVSFSATKLPPPSELRRLIEVFDRSEHPIVMHCRQGADRTSLAATVYLLLYSDADFATALKQCSFRYSHIPYFGTYQIDRFFEMYGDWLKANNLRHEPVVFRRWATTIYTADPAPARIELIGEVPLVLLGEALTLTIRATNLSHSVWQFHTGANTSIQAWYKVIGPTGELIGVYRAGRFEARVAPGESIDIPIPLLPFHAAGNYRVIVDLADHHVCFVQLGSEWLEVGIRVEDTQGR